MTYRFIDEGDNYGKFGQVGTNNIFEGAEIPVKELYRIISSIYIIEDLGHSIVTQENLLEFIDKKTYPNLIRIPNEDRMSVPSGYKVREPQLKPRFLCLMKILDRIRDEFGNDKLDF